ncbi:MAG: hypothetical protein ILA25_04600 [Prevotella sp.]|nr:hypothetical protein [Prevotella sp.]
MKKTYINPEMNIVKIQTAQMIAASPGYGGNTNATSGNLSRRGDFFEDDDDEYEE